MLHIRAGGGIITENDANKALEERNHQLAEKETEIVLLDQPLLDANLLKRTTAIIGQKNANKQMFRQRPLNGSSKIPSDQRQTKAESLKAMKWKIDQLKSTERIVKLSRRNMQLEMENRKLNRELKERKAKQSRMEQRSLREAIEAQQQISALKEAYKQTKETLLERDEKLEKLALAVVALNEEREQLEVGMAEMRKKMTMNDEWTESGTFFQSPTPNNETAEIAPQNGQRSPTIATLLEQCDAKDEVISKLQRELKNAEEKLQETQTGLALVQKSVVDMHAAVCSS